MGYLPLAYGEPLGGHYENRGCNGRSAKDVSELALNTFFGMAVLVDCKDLAPRTALGGEILERFLFFGFPAKMGGLESFPIRAVAIEGIEQKEADYAQG